MPRHAASRPASATRADTNEPAWPDAATSARGQPALWNYARTRPLNGVAMGVRVSTAGGSTITAPEMAPQFTWGPRHGPQTPSARHAPGNPGRSSVLRAGGHRSTAPAPQNGMRSFSEHTPQLFGAPRRSRGAPLERARLGGATSLPYPTLEADSGPAQGNWTGWVRAVGWLLRGAVDRYPMRHDPTLYGSAVFAGAHWVGRAGGDAAAADESDL
jgi:hypothetical protein